MLLASQYTAFACLPTKGIVVVRWRDFQNMDRVGHYGDCDRNRYIQLNFIAIFVRLEWVFAIA